MRRRVGSEIDEAAPVVPRRHYGGDAHIEKGAGLALRIHSRKAVHQPGDEVLPSAIENARAFGDGDGIA